MNLTIARVSLQALTGQRRGLFLMALPLVLIALAGVLRALTGEPVSANAVIVEVGIALVLPLVALLAANGVLGPAVDDGSVVYLLATPVSRYAVAVSTFVVAAGVAAALAVTGLVGAVLAGGLSRRWVVVALVVALVGAVLYAALFTALSAITRHGMIAGLIYVLVVEALLGRFLDGMRYLSVRALAERAGELAGDVTLPLGEVSTTYLVVAGAVILLGGVGLAGWRLSRFQMRAES